MNVRDGLRSRAPRSTSEVADRAVLAAVAVFAWTLPNDTLLHDSLGIGLSRVFGVLMAVVWGADVIRRRRLTRPGLLQLAAVAYTAWHALSLTWTMSVDRTLTPTFTVAQLTVLLFIVHDRVERPAHLRLVLGSFIAGCAVAALDTFLDVAGSPDEFGRAYFASTGADPNSFAGMIAMGVVAAGLLLVTTDSRWSRRSLVVYLAVAPIAIVASYSRMGALVGLLAYGGVLAVLWTDTSRSIRPVLPAAAALAVVGLFLRDRLDVSRYAGLFDRELGSHTSVELRLDLIGIGWRSFLDHPFLGVGAGNFPLLTVDEGPLRPMVAHNAYVGVAAELGLVGLALFLTILLVPVVRHLRRRPPLGPLGILLVLVPATVAATISWENQKALWLFVGCVAALARMPDASVLAARWRSASADAPSGEDRPDPGAGDRPASPTRI